MRVLQNAIRIVGRGLLKLIQNSCAIRSSTKCLIEWKAVFLALYFIVNAPSPKTCFCLQITTFDETNGDDSWICILWFRVRSPGVLYSSNFLPSSDHTCEFEEHTYCQNLLDIHEMSCLSLMIVKIFMFCFLSCPQLGLFTKQLGNKSCSPTVGLIN